MICRLFSIYSKTNLWKKKLKPQIKTQLFCKISISVGSGVNTKSFYQLLWDADVKERSGAEAYFKIDISSERHSFLDHNILALMPGDRGQQTSRALLDGICKTDKE